MCVPQNLPPRFEGGNLQVNEHVLNVIVSWLRGMPPKSEREIPVEAVKNHLNLDNLNTEDKSEAWKLCGL